MVVQGTRAIFVGEGDACRPMVCPTVVLRVAACPTVVLRLSYALPRVLRLSYGCPTMPLGAGCCLTRRSPVADMACARSGPRGFCAAMSG